MENQNESHQNSDTASQSCSCSHHTTDTFSQMIAGNLNWAHATSKEDPEFFNQLAKSQQPEVLWIGCADSRAPANVITGIKAGGIFEHRNVANVCVNSDLNMLSVLDYAVRVLKVRHVIVAGHHGCGGVTAALSNKRFGMIDNWLRHIKDVYRIYSQELDQIADEQDRLRRLVELNVVEQVNNVSRTAIVENAWKAGADLQIHGWVMELSTGLIKDLGVTKQGIGGRSGWNLSVRRTENSERLFS